MRLLQRHPDETARGTPDEEPPLVAPVGSREEAQRLAEPGGPPTLERWDLVESRWSLGSVLVLLAGATLAVLGMVAAARTGINETWYRPVERVAGLRHTPLLAAVEAGVGALLVIAGLTGRQGLAALVCIAGAIAAGVAAIEAERVAEELALQRWWAIALAAVGAGLAVVSMMPWPHFVERHYTRAARIAPSAAPDANTRAAEPWPRTSNPAGGA
jgi:hypothetical protein